MHLCLIINPSTVEASAYDYQFVPPHYPTDLSEVLVWNVPPSGGTIPSNLQNLAPEMQWKKYLLIVMPDSLVTGSITAKFLKYKGVYLIGGEFEKVGSIYQSSEETNVPLPGGHVMQIGFSSGSSIRPFLFLSNIDFDIPTNSTGLPLKSYWGDFLQTGSNSSNTADWVDIYMQKIKIRKGHYFYTSTTNSFDPHSDVFQSAAGGWHKLYVSNMDFAWYGQGYFIVPSDISGMNYPPSDGRAKLKDIIARPMPAETNVYKDGYAESGYLVHISSYHPNTLDPVNGKYYSIYLNNFNFLTLDVNSGKTWKPSYFSVKGLSTSWNSNLNRVEFNYFKHPNHMYPYFDGPGVNSANKAYAKYHSTTSTLPNVVQDSEIGRSVRITSAKQLIDTIQASIVPALKVSKITFTDSNNQIVNELPSSGIVKTNVQLINTSDHFISTGITVALYNGDRLESVKVLKPFNVQPESVLAVPSIETNLTGPVTQKKIKVFVWRDLNKIVPLATINSGNVNTLPHNSTPAHDYSVITPDYTTITTGSKVFYTDHDAYVYDLQPDINYGTQDSLFIKDINNIGFNRRSYIRFNLSSFDQLSTISSATLRVYARNTTSSSPVKINIFNVSDSWNETSITWNNAPSISEPAISHFIVEGTQGQYKWYDIDVTPYVKTELNGDKIISFCLSAANKSNDLVQILSKENTQYSHPAELIINY